MTRIVSGVIEMAFFFLVGVTFYELGIPLYYVLAVVIAEQAGKFFVTR